MLRLHDASFLELSEIERRALIPARVPISVRVDSIT